MKLLFFSLLFLNIHFLFSQELTFPPKINLFQHSESQRRFNSFPHARVWGWSNNGKVAFSVESDGVAGQIIGFFVFDMITNSNVFELIMRQHTHNYTIRDEALYNFYANNILNALRIFNIISYQTEFLPFPFSVNNVEYNTHLIVEYQKDQMALGRDDVDVVSRYTVVITANDRSKVIANFDGLSNAFISTFSVYAAGYFLSPFESRALVVVAESFWVHSMFELRYRFIGFDLETGFN